MNATSVKTPLGIGQEIGVKFAEHGCTKLFLVDVNEKGLQETQELVMKVSKTASVIARVFDISNESAVEAMVKACVDTYGRLDFAINNAGVAKGNVRTSDATVETLDWMYSINEKGVRQGTHSEKHPHAEFFPRSSSAKSTRSNRC